MSAQDPVIGEWYRIRGEGTFEVVAVDEHDRTVEVQYFDGTVEELDFEDWEAQRANGEIEDAEPPEDWSGSVDVDADDESLSSGSGRDAEQQMADGFDGLDLFEPPDFGLS